MTTGTEVPQHIVIRYGYADLTRTTMDGHHVIIGPFDTREAAEAHAARHENSGDVVEWGMMPGPFNPCPDCGSTCERLPMSAAAATVYDALFPVVLDWSESEDCGMAELMRNVAETAAAALGADIERP